MSPRLRPGRRVGATAALVGVLLAMLSWPLRPQPPVLSEEVHGDAALAAHVRELLAGETGVGGVAIALVDAAGPRSAALGDADTACALRTDTPMEIGSVGKALTGLLLADLEAAGAVSADLSAAEALGVDDAGLAQVTLADLATHQSGLPRLPLSGLLGGLAASVAGANPYAGWDGARVRAAAAGRPLGGPSEFRYSNLGAATLGAALDAATATPYPQLLHERVLQPVGMGDTVVATASRQLPEHRAEGVTAAGARAAPWLGFGYAAAGVGHWSTVEDLARLLRALLDGEAPGADALAAHRPLDDGAATGLGWLHRSENGTSVVWHNGATAGSAPSWASTSRRTEAWRCWRAPISAWTIWACACSVWALRIRPCWLWRRRGTGRGAGGTASRPLDRVDVVAAAASTVLMLFLLRQLGSWHSVPTAVWWFTVAVVGTGLAVGVLQWKQLPTASGKRARWRWIRGSVSAGVSLGLLTALLVA